MVVLGGEDVGRGEDLLGPVVGFVSVVRVFSGLVTFFQDFVINFDTPTSEIYSVSLDNVLPI